MSYYSTPSDKDGKYEETHMRLVFTPGEAGKQLFVDTDGKPLERAVINISSDWSYWTNSILKVLLVGALYTSPEMYIWEIDKPVPTQILKFSLQDDTLIVSNNIGEFGTILMSDGCATALFDTIDALIPVSTSHMSQTELRGGQEVKPPKALSPARRTRPPGR